MAKDPPEGQTVPTKAMVEKLSAMLGCSGSHKVGEDAWGPCESDRVCKNLLNWVTLLFVNGKQGKKRKVVTEFMELKAKKERHV